VPTPILRFLRPFVFFCLVLFFFGVLPLSGNSQANGAGVTVTITQRAPIESLSDSNNVIAVSESGIGAKLTLMSTDGSLVILQDQQGRRYRIALAATDYVPPTLTPANNQDRVIPPITNSPTAPAQTVSLVPEDIVVPNKENGSPPASDENVGQEINLQEVPIPSTLAQKDPRALYAVPVLVIRFVPKTSDGRFVDPYKAPNYYDLKPIPLANKMAELDKSLVDTRYYFQEGTRYHAYKNPSAPPSITYPVVGIYNVFDLPPASTQFFRHNGKRQNVPYPDWFKIMEAINARRWVEEKGVREIWVWSTHYMGDEPSFDPRLIPEVNLRCLNESNMAGPFGNISNSLRRKDMPVYNNTYTVYEFNLHRSVNENVHNHIHQIEAVLNERDGRDIASREDPSKFLFWGRFVGADASGHLTSPRRCGWCHYPPNATKDYDYHNMDKVMSDIEDWTPDGSGKFALINADAWNNEEIKWYLLWMQSIPGRDNGLKDGDQTLTNWWRFLGDWDNAKKENVGLEQ
jgi:hypothetical protein